MTRLRATDGTRCFSVNRPDGTDRCSPLTYSRRLWKTHAAASRRGWDGVGRVVLDSHANMARYAQAGAVDYIVFNLGWLPGGDHRIFTRPDSTIAAIEAGLGLLREGGRMCVSIYYGGASGYEERDALLDYFKTIDPTRFTVLVTQFANRAGDPPIPVLSPNRPEENDNE